MREFTFDVKFFASVTIKAENEAAARAALSASDFELCVIWPNDVANTYHSVDMDGEPDLTEIDGEEVS